MLLSGTKLFEMEQNLIGGGRKGGGKGGSLIVIICLGRKWSQFKKMSSIHAELLAVGHR